MAIPPTSGANLSSAIRTLVSEINTDLIALQEVDVHQDRSGNGNQVREVAESIGAKYWAFAPSMYGTPGEKWHGQHPTDEQQKEATTQSGEFTP